MRLVSRCENKHTSYSRGSRNQQHFPRFSTNSRWLPLARRSHDVPMLGRPKHFLRPLLYLMANGMIQFFLILSKTESIAPTRTRGNYQVPAQQGQPTLVRRKWVLVAVVKTNQSDERLIKGIKQSKDVIWPANNVIKVILVLTEPTRSVQLSDWR